MGEGRPPETPGDDEARNEKDLAVIEALRNGELDADDAWRELIGRHRKRLFSLAYRFTSDYGEAEELTHEIIVRLFRQLHRFDPRAHFAVWLSSVARNHCIDRYRVRVRERQRLALGEIEPENLLGNPRLSPDRLYQRRETRDNLRRALEQLSPRLREVIELRFFEELPYEDICLRLGVPEGTVKSRIHRGRAELKRQLEAIQEAPPARSQESASAFPGRTRS